MPIMQGNKKVANVYNINNNSYSVPIGSIIPFGGSTIPIGFLLCDGQAVSKTKYVELYKIVGNLYGESGSEDTFLLPDLRDKFVQGANGNLGTTKEAGLPNITGEVGYIKSIGDGSYWQGININTGVFKSSQQTVRTSPTATTAAESTSHSQPPSTIVFKASDSNSIYGNSDTVQPPSVYLNFVIKAEKISDQYADAVGALIDDSSVSADKVWSSEKVNNSTIPYILIDTTKDIDFDEYTETGYYTPNKSFSTGWFTHSILNAPTDGWLPAGGFGLEVKTFDNTSTSKWFTQILYSYVGTDNNSAPIYSRTFFYDGTKTKFSPWKRIADIDDTKVSENEVWSSKKVNDKFASLPFKWKLIGTSTPETGATSSNTFNQTMSGGNPFCVYHSSGIFCFGNGIPANRGKLYGMTSGQVASVTYTAAGLLTVEVGSGTAYIYEMEGIG